MTGNIKALLYLHINRGYLIFRKLFHENTHTHDNVETIS